jgi:hypothetical protein
MIRVVIVSTAECRGPRDLAKREHARGDEHLKTGP